MTVFLIRHADAADAEDDASRELSEKGRGQVRRLANFLRGQEAFQPREFWHSGLIRARETAELLARGLRSEAPLREVAGLEPGADLAPIAARIEDAKRSVAVVGHQPQLAALGTLLATGRPWPVAFAMKKCSVLALERVEEGRRSCWIASWSLSPQLLKE